MDSLPERHIDDLPAASREDAYSKVGRVFLLRKQGSDTEAEVAHIAGFGSADAMHQQLSAWGFGGLLPPGEKRPRETRKAQSVEGTREELPPIRNTATTFRDTIRTLEVYLEQATTLKETTKGRYFIDEGGTDEGNVREARGVQWHPHPYVVALIAVSILEHRGDWGFVEHLIDELHPKPAEANRQQLVRFIYGKKVDAKGRPILNKEGRPVDYGDGLLDRAKQVATLIRGKPKIPPGVKSPAIPSHDQFTALYMRSLADEGFSQEQVLQSFREGWERWKVEQLQSLREEQQAAKAASDQATVDEIEQEIRLTEGEEYDEGDFYRIWGLSRYLT
jgi:hypothetical protein